eukprot:CAMPEP_0117650890 /NCGR_PEP_ID=MMETSP0804-20121206/1785_1 /TAXON_ID=1074897 /ORGANISM="Tetraselmis astigmatica, Strain CCMP880" /LENGTH=447 /DNA_ID=CAMNT_0005456801 /DNA_START=177 /DNA_END=1520 /DNA_ORIENTATION=+
MRLLVLAVILAVSQQPAASELYLPSFLTSRSGETKPQKRSSLRSPNMEGGVTERADAARRRQAQYSVRVTSSCGGAPTAWMPLSRDAQVMAYHRFKERDLEASAKPKYSSTDNIVVTGTKDEEAPPEGLKSLCAKEQKVKVSANLNRAQEMLATCLQEEHTAWCPGADRTTINEAVHSLKGIQMLGVPPMCMVTNKKTCPPSAADKSNRETGGIRVPVRARQIAEAAAAPIPPTPPKDLKHVYRRCAIVGNGPSLSNSENGKYIDKFDAVFRFNSITNTDPVKGRELYVGRKTTFRMFNRVTSLELAAGLYKLHPSMSEHWLFWHQNSRMVLGAIQKRFPKVPLYMLSPAEVNWQLKVYFQLRRDLRELGFGPFGCPSNLNTGLHAILMTQHLCEQIGTFGISHTLGAMHGRFSADNHTISRFHAWDFDSLLIRLLHFASKIDVCNV